MPHEAKQTAQKMHVVHHNTLSDSLRIRIVWFQPKQDSDRILFFKNKVGSDHLRSETIISGEMLSTPTQCQTFVQDDDASYKTDLNPTFQSVRLPTTSIITENLIGP